MPALSLPLSETDVANVGNEAGKIIYWIGNGVRTNGPFGPAPLLTNGAVVEQAAPVIGRHDQASYGAFIYVEDHPGGAVFSRMDNDKAYRGWDLFLIEGRPLLHIIDQYPDHALEIEANNHQSRASGITSW